LNPHALAPARRWILVKFTVRPKVSAEDVQKLEEATRLKTR